MDLKSINKDLVVLIIKAIKFTSEMNKSGSLKLLISGSIGMENWPGMNSSVSNTNIWVK